MVFDLAYVAPATKRMDRWLSSLSRTVGELVEGADKMTPEALATNDAFISTVYALTQTAMKTSSEAKLDLLRSAIKATGRGIVLTDLLLNTFLTILDRYSAEHVRFLREMDDPAALDKSFATLRRLKPDAISKDEDGSESARIEDIATHLIDWASPEVAEQLSSDLTRDALCKRSEGFAHMIGPARGWETVTTRGSAFLRFVAGG